MKEARFNPRAIARRNGEPIPSSGREVRGARVEARLLPKAHVMVLPRERYLEQDGRRFLTGPAGAPEPIADGVSVVFEGDEVQPELLDFVVSLNAMYAEPSALMPDGNVRAAAITLLELTRVDYLEFRKRGQAVLRGQQVPGFNEEPGTWEIPGTSS